MALYSYEGKQVDGKKVLGKIQAASAFEARDSLQKRGIIVLQVYPLNEWLNKELNLGVRTVKNQEFVLFLRQFSTLLKAGIPIVSAIQVSAEQTVSKPLKGALHQVKEEVNSGISLSEAAKKHPTIFPELFVNMIFAGEVGGNLDEIVDRLATSYEKQHRTKQKVIATLTYPLVVGFFALLVVTFLLTFVVPMFVSMFANMDQELPFLTIWVMNVGEFMTSFWWILLVVVFLILLFILYVKEDQRLLYYTDYLLLKIPFVGKLLQKAVLARMTRMMSSLFASSVPILDAVTIVERIIKNQVVNSVLKDARSHLERGESMTTPMKEHWVFPPLVTQLISVGEATGTLDSMLEQVASYYEEEVDAGTEQLKAFIEPVMIVAIALLVGIIVLAIMMPMFSLFENIS
ncbi:type II secretion system F family protein [Alkalihalobacillus trypoxylicola]|uniref:Type II secretion system protein F n=1 Tax=Alkalihalobacillus trypoxylicola TaxID=519424 RepID=A0A162ECZ6_9BACI|nr:type II secretion system F family protein [Alkalihalobacillus trypoxylicola]KYG32303.1 type II secretion system protein F [Alkalihalobacillus trypoxylicola]